MPDKEPTPSEQLPRIRPGGRSYWVVKEIFRTTLAMLGEKGLSGIGFKEVAERAGVNRATLYRRWRTREDLVLDAILDSATDQVVAPDLGSLEKDLTAMLETLAAWLQSPVGRAALTANLEMALTDDASRARRIQLWQERRDEHDPIFDRAVARGELSADFDRQAALAMVTGGIYTRIINQNQQVDSAWIQRLVGVFKLLTRP